MLSTQSQHWTCSGCTHKYEGQEGVKISRNGDSARVVWKKVRIPDPNGKGSQVREFPTIGATFACVYCGTEIEV